MPAAINPQPLGQGNSFPFGPVRLGETLVLILVVTNVGNSNLVFGASAGTITVVQGNGDFGFLSKPDGLTIDPGNSALFEIIFTPTAAATTEDISTLQINSNSVSGPTLITLTGICAALSDTFVQVTGTFQGHQTAAVVPFGNVVAGTPVTSELVTVANRTLSSITVTLIALTASGYAVINETGSLTILPAHQLTFNLQLTPAADMPNQDDIAAVTITNSPQSYTTNLEATYNTLPIIPVFVIGGTDFEMLLGFFSGGGVVSMLQADAEDLDCEEDAFFTRQYDYKIVEAEKQLQRLLLRYERLGPAVVTVTYASVSPLNQPSINTTRTFDAATDGLLRSILYDGSIAGEIIKLTFTCLADEGPVSITLFTMYAEPRGEYVEAT
jgi:hypothetical protein